jgi:small nuclear ribonucleoprotein E
MSSFPLSSAPPSAPPQMPTSSSTSSSLPPSSHSSRKARVMTQPINQIFRFLQSRQRLQVWLHDSQAKIEGILIGFDEFMNFVVDEAVEVEKNGDQNKLGRILLKGENVTLVRKAPVREEQNKQNTENLMETRS